MPSPLCFKEPNLPPAFAIYNQVVPIEHVCAAARLWGTRLGRVW